MADLLQQPIIAFFFITLLFGLGDFISTKTRAWIPSIFVISLGLLLGFWTFLPLDLTDIAGIAPIGSKICTLLIVTHMGTTISLKELAAQWKVVIICIAGLLGMILLGYFVGTLFIDKNYVVAGLPPLTGGIVATLMMQAASAELGLPAAGVMAICMFVMQGFAGYPLVAVLLRKEGRGLLKDFRGMPLEERQKLIASMDDEAPADQPAKKRLIPMIPEKYYSTAVSLARLALVASLAYFVQRLTTPWGNFKINQAVAALILGIVFTEIGFLEKNALRKNGTFNFFMFALLAFAFGTLSGATPQMVGQILLPLLGIIVLGVLGMGLFSVLCGKLLKFSPFMAFATALTALCGFPPNYILTDEACKALADTPEERKFLMGRMLPQMIVGGFVTVTIASVIIAGLMVPMLG